MHEKEHAENCFERCGRRFSHVHAFLDQYYQDFGASHRCLLHHKKGVDLIAKKFGEEAREPAKQHILEDLPLATDIPEDWHFYGDPIFLKLEDYGRFRLEFKMLYPDDF